jgi:hypothetical protein
VVTCGVTDACIPSIFRMVVENSTWGAPQDTPTVVNQMEMLLAAAARSSILKYTGIPLGFPGKPTDKAIVRMVSELRKQNTLGGLKTKDLIHEGHKY